MNHKDIRDIIKSSKSSIMSVTFTKIDGSERVISFNPLTAKGLAGDKASDSAKQAVETRKVNNPHLISVCDQSLLAKGDDPKKCWRSVNLDTIKRIKVKGEDLWVE
jgi:hypothetical protein